LLLAPARIMGTWNFIPYGRTSHGVFNGKVPLENFVLSSATHYTSSFREMLGSELLSAEMKQRGVMICRVLSFSDVNFSVENAALSEENRLLYDSCTKLVRLWETH